MWGITLYYDWVLLAPVYINHQILDMLSTRGSVGGGSTMTQVWQSNFCDNDVKVGKKHPQPYFCVTRQVWTNIF